MLLPVKKNCQNYKRMFSVNTAWSRGWELRTYQTWTSQRNQHCKDQYPVNLFDKPHPPDISCNILQIYVMGKKEERMDLLTPCIYQLLCGLLKYSHSLQKDPSNFLGQKDVQFKKLHGTCNYVFWDLHENGVGIVKNPLKLSQKKTKINRRRQDRYSQCHYPKRYMPEKCAAWEVKSWEI